MFLYHDNVCVDLHKIPACEMSYGSPYNLGDQYLLLNALQMQ